MLYLYAITGPADPPPGALGLRDAPLRAVWEDGLCAVVSEHAELQLEASEEDLWAHESAVEALMEQGPVLPMRLGSIVLDEAAARQTLRSRAEEFEAGLERVLGAVELGVRATLDISPEEAPERPATGAGPGTRYMLGRLAVERDSAEIVRLVHQPLSELARESTRRLRSKPQPTLNGSYLVDRDQVDRFRSRVEELERELDSATIVCTGPWPPYSFASEGRS